MGDDEDCYDGVYVTSVRQAKVFLKEQLKFLGVVVWWAIFTTTQT